MADLPFLKPCPWCGNKPILVETVDRADGFTHETTVWCQHCGIQKSDEYESGAIAGWNNRADETEMVEALKEADEHLEEMRRDPHFHPIADCPVLNKVRRVLAHYGEGAGE